MNPYISTIVMTYNEVKSLEATVLELNKSLIGIGCSYEIVIVDDGSYDGSGLVADRLAKDIKGVRVIHHDGNKGLGGVYSTGFNNAAGDLVTFFPADGQFPAEIIGQFVFLIENADMVLGYLPDRNSSLVAKALSLLEKTLYGLLFGPLPRFQGIMMFRRELFKKMQLKSTGRSWTILMELIIRIKQNGYKIISVPTQFRSRTSGVSKINNLSTIWENLTAVIALRLNF